VDGAHQPGPVPLGDRPIDDETLRYLRFTGRSATPKSSDTASPRSARSLTQQQIADRMGVSKGPVSQIERGKLSGKEVLARYANALGGRFHQAIYFDDGDITAIA
jgi:DNA-binding XRE family transcriptional regulator